MTNRDLQLSPAMGEVEFSDPTLVGEWATELPKMLARAQTPPWCSYAVREVGRVVGLAGFKGAPDAAGRVELAYLTLLSEQGRGIATIACGKLVSIAAEAGTATVLAHTLPQENASTAVLRANGFAFGGAILDPEDGEVWRWARSLDSQV